MLDVSVIVPAVTVPENVPSTAAKLVDVNVPELGTKLILLDEVSTLDIEPELDVLSSG